MDYLSRKTHSIILSIRSSLFSEPEENKSSSFQVCMNLYRGMTGLGVLTLASGVKDCGIILGMIIIIFVTSAVYWCLAAVVEITEIKEAEKQSRISRLSELVYFTFNNKTAAIAVDILVTLMQMGACIAYILFFIVFFNNVFCYFEFGFMCGSRFKILVLSLIVIFPMVMVQNISRYTKLSTLGNILMFITLVHISKKGVQGKNLFDISGVPIYFGMSVFTLEAIGMIMELRHSMRTKAEFSGVLRSSFIQFGILFVVFPLISYMTFGKNLQEVVLFNLPNEDFYTLTIQIFVAIVLCTSIPLQLFPVFMMFDDLFLFLRAKYYPDEPPKKEKEKVYILKIEEKEEDEKEVNEKKESLELQLLEKAKKNKKKTKIHWRKWFNFFLRFLLLILLGVIAYQLPDITSFLGLVGNFSSASLGYILPATIYFLVMRNELKWHQKTLNLLFLAIGIFGAVLGIYFSLLKIIRKKSG